MKGQKILSGVTDIPSKWEGSCKNLYLCEISGRKLSLPMSHVESTKLT